MYFEHVNVLLDDAFCIVNYIRIWSFLHFDGVNWINLEIINLIAFWLNSVRKF